MPLLSRLTVAASLLLVVLAAAIPWGLGESHGLMLAALPFAALHYWARIDPGTAPPGLAFLTGLAVDLLGRGPLGYWALVYLAGLAATQLPVLAGAQPGFLGRWVNFALASVPFWLTAWIVASLYLAEAAPVLGMLWALGLAIAIYPLIGALLGIIEPLVAAPRSINLDRGG